MIPVSPPVSPLLHKSSRGASASDRLEADKAKYVKTPQVIERRQIPVINASFTPAMPRRSLLAGNNCETQAEYPCSNTMSPVVQRKNISPPYNKEVRSNHSHQTSPTPRNPRRLIQPDNNLVGCYTHSKNPNFLVCHQGNESVQNSPEAHLQCLRRVSAWRQYRPDSLIIYRQRREVSLTGKENTDSEPGLVIRLLQGTPLLKRSNSPSRNLTQPRPQEMPVSPRTQKMIEQSSLNKDSCLLDPHTQQATSDKQTCTTPTDSEHFFETCGLEGSLLDLLENVYKMSGDTPFGSLESITGVSGGKEGAFSEDVKEEKTPVSVIERNARVIKWIYSCQQARSTGNQSEKQKPRESTV
ncbi:protein FAM110D [Pelobates fuscus]|uniref:protein FAM110D n=1 Tax=Pelobates fuscus TaxID=191477 RepID=UPI002FE47CE2